MTLTPVFSRWVAVLMLATAGALTGFAAEVSLDDNFRPALPIIPDRTFTLTDFGAVGDGKALNTEAFQKAIASINQTGG